MSTPARSLLKSMRRQAVKRGGISEKRIQAHLVKALRSMGFFVSTFSQAQRAQMTAGIPDCLAMHRGWRNWSDGGAAHMKPLHVWVEVKRPGMKPTLPQRAWHKYARDCGANVLVASSLDELLSGLRELGAPV